MICNKSSFFYIINNIICKFKINTYGSLKSSTYSLECSHKHFLRRLLFTSFPSLPIPKRREVSCESLLTTIATTDLIGYNICFRKFKRIGMCSHYWLTGQTWICAEKLFFTLTFFTFELEKLLLKMFITNLKYGEQ